VIFGSGEVRARHNGCQKYSRGHINPSSIVAPGESTKIGDWLLDAPVGCELVSLIQPL